ncbi:M23 family metallopeptidase [Salinibacterium sp. G-O1]|uniref:M23 family metallopeptidase n=1 Tax=Salinibacterium sp. G-O1 TaxID=3046208 RepID=UPI0024BBDAFA|nr:M23 family metallopeptidase [Salinibacterium sp. G-O1]MDJ0336421.1 M23 family metallopeptidase [Salinibacterium sp. G-O1]
MSHAVRSARRSPKRHSSAGSRLVSLGSLIIVGALLVGSSLPVNVLTTDSSATAATAAIAVAPRLSAGQTLRVSGEAIDSAPVRDNFGAVSYAQILSAQLSGVDYFYSQATGIVRWPLPASTPTTDGYGERASGFHKGVDFVPGEGAPIYAIADGYAVSSGYDDSGYGDHVVIQHNIAGVNVRTNYAHMILGSSPIVAGQQIVAGDFLGLVGDTGISYGAHLHFEVYVNDVPVDPYAWLRANASGS